MTSLSQPSDLARSPDADTFADDTRRLLQTRLALVFAVLVGVSVFYAASNVVALALAGTLSIGALVVPASTLAIGIAHGVLALRCRRGQRSMSELHALDAGATALTCWLTAAVMTQVPSGIEASISLQLGVTYVLMARAVLLPSSGRRTLAICLLALLPDGVVGTLLRLRDVEGPSMSDWLMQGYIVFRSLGVTAFLATLTSHVIYGLRRQVQESARVGAYELREKIGQGGMGVVYRATHALLRRDTAVKLISPGRISAKNLARFEREVQLTARLTHPGTVSIFDYGKTDDGISYYAMEYLEGGDLERLVAYTGPLAPGRVIWIMEQVCRALSEAHDLGLIHRDIKPSNVILCERGGEGDVAKLLDFGLVKDLNAGGGAQLTHTEAIAGTPLYIAPESITSPDTVDGRADLYSLGAVAYFLLVGEPVFPRAGMVEVCAAHLHEAPVAPSERRAGLGPELDAVILRCLAKRPEARFENAAALRAALLATSAATWTRETAAAWWSAHGAAFCAHTEAARLEQLDRSGAQESALRVDLRGRRPRAS
jgi:eukaryotic-like serine/threonine-protein kinase